MRQCPTCGQSIPEQFPLCGYCGTSLGPPVVPVAAAPPPIPTLTPLPGVGPTPSPGPVSAPVAAAAPQPAPGPGSAAPPLAFPPPVETRRTVTVLFSDLKGSTALGERLDPEAVREVMSLYFDALQAEIERHGGTIEKFIGDAVMAVFGLEHVREDDALRAVRAAAGMGRALATINDDLEPRYGVRLANRTGVNTGEVVSGDAHASQRLVTGDVVNTAARLEQAAAENEILLGPLTHALVRDAVDVEPVMPLALKGKAEPVPAWRLVRVRPAAEGRTRRQDTPFVGRDGELARLRGILDEAIATAAPRLAILTGDAGVGKSRLVRELVTGAQGVARGLRGRCLSYGEGITFWPIGEIVRTAAGIGEDDTPEDARPRLLALAGERDVAAKLASILGLSPATFPLPEVFWAVRRLVERLGAEQPLIVVVDDVHWAQPALLDLFEHLLAAGTAAPLLLVLTARPEFVDEAPAWIGREGALHLPLEPLDERAAAAVVDNLAGAAVPLEVSRRVIATAEGNPLFVEQLVETLIESGMLRLVAGRWERVDEATELALPPTIQALVAARLDRVGRDERAAVEPASVIGLRFEEDAVAELVGPELRPSVALSLGGLVRRRLVRPLAASAEADGSVGAYRFQHQVVRDVAYDGILKRRRVALHEGFVRWADRVNAARDRGREFEEILGYHLEQAYRLRAELGPVDAAGVQTGREGARRLASAGGRAFDRGDMHAAANLLGRASALLGSHDPLRLEIAPDRAEAHLELGEFAAAEAVLADAMVAADELFDDRNASHAVVMRRLLRFFAGDEEADAGHAEREIDQAVGVFEREGDELGLARAWRLRFGWANTRGDFERAARAADEVMRRARACGSRRLETRGMTGYAIAALYGPTPVGEAIAEIERLLDDVADDHRTDGLLRCFLAQLYAMAGDVGRARRTYGQARTILDELGRGILSASVSINSWRVEMLAGDPAAAERELRRDFAVLDAMGERYLLSTAAGGLAIALVSQGRVDEAASFAARAEELAAVDDVESQALWRAARARIAGRRGQAEEAERLAWDTVAAVAETSSPWVRSAALLDAAEALAGAGRADVAGSWLEEARRISVAKGDVATERLAIARLTAPGD